MNRVVITGMGWITPMGHTIEDVWKSLLAGESGIAHTSIFNASTFPTTISAEVKDFNLKSHVSDLSSHAGVGRNTSFALAACAQAWKSAGLSAAKLDLDRVGIYLGSGEGSLDFDAYTTAALSSWTEGRHAARQREVGPHGVRADERHARDRAGTEHAALAPGDPHRRPRAGDELPDRVRGFDAGDRRGG
jgi:3-oxoacyl-(acyl-carrier-protein) synthase